MLDWFIFIVGLITGAVLMSIWSQARANWQKGRGMVKAPDKARSEGKQKYEKARSDAATGRRQMLRAFFYYLVVAAILLVALGVVIMLATR